MSLHSFLEDSVVFLLCHGNISVDWLLLYIFIFIFYMLGLLNSCL